MEAVRSRPESIGVVGTMPTDVGRVILWLRLMDSSTIVEAIR